MLPNQYNKKNYKEPYESSILVPTNERFSSTIGLLTSKYITQLYSPKRQNLDEWIKMVEKDPVASKCVALKALRAQLSIGDYTHKNRSYQDFIRNNLSNIQSGSFRNIVAELASAMPFGASFAEVVFSNQTPGFRNQWRLKGIYPLDLRRVSVKGRYGEVKWIVYRDENNCLKTFDYKKCIHIKNTSTIPFDQNTIWGVADCEQALSYYKLKQLVLTELAIAAKNNATGILWGQTSGTQKTQILDSEDKPILDAYGKPKQVSKQKALYMQLKDLSNNDLLVTDGETNIRLLQLQTGENFWNYALNLIEENMMLAFGVPRQIFKEGSGGGLGNVGLSMNHKAVLDATIESIVTSIRDELIKRVVKPLLIFNFGEKEDFGEFTFTAQEDPSTINSKISTILSAIASGVFSPDDLGIQETLRKLLGLPPLSEGDKKDADEQSRVQEILKWYNNQASIASAKSQVQETAVKEEQMKNAPELNPTSKQQEALDSQATEDTGEYPTT